MKADPVLDNRFSGFPPRAFELLRWGVRLVGVRVTLCAADGASVSELLEASWRRRAPKRLIARV